MVRQIPIVAAAPTASLAPALKTTRRARVVLLRLPFFSPLSPPLGIAMLKAYLESHGHEVSCHDFNVDGELWTLQGRYFALLESLDTCRSQDGDSKLWSLLNAHFLAVLSGADAAACEKLLGNIAPLFGMSLDASRVHELHALVERFQVVLDDRLAQIPMAGCDFVGTSTYTTSLAPSLHALRWFKQRYPGVRTLMGGGVFADDLALGSENLEVLLRKFDEVDHVVLGEGEELLRRLVEGDFADRRVITLADIERRTVPVDKLPTPDFSDFGLHRYLHLSIEGGRSCPFQCSFCSETVQWGDYRKKPAAQLARQMVSLSNSHGISKFFMGDSLINPYINGLSDQLLTEGRELLFDGYLRADKAVGNPEHVQAWARAGLFRARLGLETAAPRLLEVMDKRTTPQSMLNALRTLSEAGIRPSTTWLVGYPSETEEDFRDTLEFVREAHPYLYDLHAHPYYYYPYGQVASRLHASRPVFDDTVVRRVQFQLWDVEGSTPEREERFSRLRRFSALVHELGIPSTYNMAGRYAAEKRWMRLWPVARAVF